MIVTLTLNPALDLTYTLSEPQVGAVDVHRATTATLEASGKGVNVSRALHANGFRTVAVLPVGGSTGHHLVELLADDGIPHRTVRQDEATRVNTTIAARGGRTAKVNGPGGRLDAEALGALTDALADALGAGSGGERWLAVCGSLPAGVAPETVGALVDLAHTHGARCAVDVSGPALTAAVSAGADLLAPNRLELAEVDPESAAAHTVPALAQVTAELARRRRTSLLVSLGEEGALFTDGAVVVHGRGPALVPVNTAGAGDALLAGWLADPGPSVHRMERALRWSRAACRAATTVAPAVPDPPDVTDTLTVDLISPDPTEGATP